LHAFNAVVVGANAVAIQGQIDTAANAAGGNNAIRKATDLNGIRDGFKAYTGIHDIGSGAADTAITNAITDDVVVDAGSAKDTAHGELLGQIFDNGWDAIDIYLDGNDVVVHNPMNDNEIKTFANITNANRNKRTL